MLDCGSNTRIEDESYINKDVKVNVLIYKDG